MGLLPQNIAIVDDDPSVRTAISRLLKAAGMDPVCYSSGLALLNHFEHDLPDCVVLDLQMPGMTGIDVLQHLHHAKIHVPIIVVTAYDEIESPDICLAAGATTYLRKPLDADQLIDAITGAIEKFEPQA